MLNLAKGISTTIIFSVATFGLLIETSPVDAQQAPLTNYVSPSSQNGSYWGHPHLGRCAFCGGGNCGGHCGQGKNCSGAHCHGSCHGSCHGHQGFLSSWSQKHHSYYMHQPALPCPGDTLYQSLEAQKLNGRVAQLAMHHFHFTFDSASQTWALTRSGWNKVYDLSRILPWTPGSIAVDPSNNPEVDAIRVQLVRDALAGYGLVETDVILARPRVPILNGVDALGIYGQRQLGTPFGNLSGRSTIGRGGGDTGSPSGNQDQPGGFPTPR